jgi:hypothetical protein
MVEMVNQVNTNPRDLGETDGSRKNDQGALDLAVPAASVPAASVVPNAIVPAVPVNKTVASINLADLPSEASMSPAPSPLEPIPAPTPVPAPTIASVNNTQPLIDLSAPEPVAELFNEKAEQSANLIENVQAEGLKATNEAKNETKNVKQRGGAKRSRKAKGKLLQFLKTLTRKMRKI